MGGLDNVAVQWPRTGRFYEPVAPDEFNDFADFAAAAPPQAGPAAALASHIAKTATVRAHGVHQIWSTFSSGWKASSTPPTRRPRTRTR